jgi:hypothetical protein
MAAFLAKVAIFDSDLDDYFDRKQTRGTTPQSGVVGE